MLNEAEGANEEMLGLKEKLSDLLNTDKDIYSQFVEKFEMEPLPAYKEIMLKIGNPFRLMQEIYELIKNVTSDLKGQIKGDYDSIQTSTYLITTPDFEKVFNFNQPIRDVSQFVNQKEKFSIYLKEHEQEEYQSESQKKMAQKIKKDQECN